MRTYAAPTEKKLIAIQCVFVGVRDGLLSVQANTSDKVCVFKDQLHDKYEAATSEPLELYLYRAQNTANTTDGVARWLERTLELLQTLSCGIIPQSVHMPEAFIDEDAIIGDAFADAPLEEDHVIHVLVLPSDQVASHGERVKRWHSINAILKQHGAWRHEPLEDEDNGEEKPIDDVREKLWLIFRSSEIEYEEPIVAPPPQDFHVLSTLLTWGENVNPCLTGASEMWMQAVTPIVWCVAHQFPGQCVLQNIELSGERVTAENVPINFQMQNRDKRVAVVQLKHGRVVDALVHATLACELLADLDNCRWVGAVVTDGVQWLFLRSLGHLIACDEPNLLRFDRKRVPTAESLGAIVGKMIHMLA